jgi:plastocyanin
MTERHLNRRRFVTDSIALVGGVVVVNWRVEPALAQRAIVDPGGLAVGINSRYETGQWFFEPMGLFIEPGQTVRWTANNWGATVTAFHPANGNHELRIPESAQPFDSGILGDIYNKEFEHTFTVPGTYDYFATHHEVLGLMGRIVVGKPGGPGEMPLGYGGREGRAPVFPDMQTLFKRLNSQEIVQKKRVPFPRDILVRRPPYRP